jgi:hypothetical protein
MRVLVPLVLVVTAGAVFMFRPAVSSPIRSESPTQQPADVRVTQEVITPSEIRGAAPAVQPTPRAKARAGVREHRIGKLARARVHQRSRSLLARLGKAFGIHVEHTSDEARTRQR